MFAFLIAALSIIGLPPFGGMWSKWFLALGTLDHGQLFLLAVLMISSLLNIAYLLPIPVRAFFTKTADSGEHEWSRSRGESVHQDGHGYAGRYEAPLPSLIALSFTALATVILFIDPDPLYQLLNQLPLAR